MKKLIKKVYELIPLKKRIFEFLKKLNLSESVYKHLHFKDIITVPVNSSTSFKIRHYGFQIENEIFWAGLTGGWEKVSLSLWTKLCKNAFVVIDVGANTGVYSLVAKSLNIKSSVYAFEPVKRVFDKLEENNKLNDFDIRCCELALSNYTGTATIYDTDEEHTYSVTVNKNLFSPGTEILKSEIKTITLDQFIEENHLTKIDLIKIDVETHEAEVLEGFSKYLKKFAPTILIEILNDEVGKNVQRIIQDIDYLYFNIDEKSGIRQVETITQRDYFNYLLCSKDVAKELKLIEG
jgi:FkbM family methyltransferase